MNLKPISQDITRVNSRLEFIAVLTNSLMSSVVSGYLISTINLLKYLLLMTITSLYINSFAHVYRIDIFLSISTRSNSYFG
jgi:hypothetical protein